jgi:hypothetical protein
MGERTRMLRRIGLRLPSASVVLAGLSCGGGGDITEPTTGSLQITSSTSGPAPDQDGYSVTLDGSDRGGLGTSGSVSIDGLAW